MKANKIRNMDLGEVERQAQDSQEQLFRFRFQMGMGQTEGLKKYRNLRKDRARLLTIMNEKRRVKPRLQSLPKAARRKVRRARTEYDGRTSR
jgi:large subunit ribosomal protein L29